MKVGLAQMEQMKVGGEKEYTSCYRLQPLIFGGGGERVCGLVDLAKDSKHTVILVSNRTMSVNFLFWLNIL